MVEMSELLELLATKFNRFMFDNFQSTEQINSAVTGTAEVTGNLFELKLNTGVLSLSTAKAYYAMNWFNPVYSTLDLRLYLNSMENLFLFCGFMEGLEEPTSVMLNSHAGLMVENGKLYFSTARTTPQISGQQKTEISGADMTKDFIYKIENDKLSTFPLPQIIPYFDNFRIITPDRIWTLKATNGNYGPWDEVHYLVFYLKNLVGAQKILRVKAVTYGEEYAD